MIQAAVLGYGNIGSGVAQVLRQNRDVIAARVGQEIDVKYVLDLRDFPGDPMEQKVVHDVSVILNDPEVQIVVETMGGTKPAYEFVKQALLAGKHVATSNKELVAAHGTELLAIARQQKVNFLFEASVGGGIPIIRPLNECIVADHIEKITGILNGTTNYMLTRMREDGMDFDGALKEAQELGFAERNPEADVEGKDACRKIAILCSLAFGSPVCAEEIPTEGITRVSHADMEYAARLGMTVKLLGSGKRAEGGVLASVAPVMLPMNHPLASVQGVMNGILVEGDISGALLFGGAGAGKLPTASAVVADVVEAALHPHETVLKGWMQPDAKLVPAGRTVRPFFVRFSGSYAEKAEETARLFAVCRVLENIRDGEYAVITGAMPEEEFYEKISARQDVLGSLRMEPQE